MLPPWMPFDKSPGRHRQPLYDPLDVTVLQVDAELWILPGIPSGSRASKFRCSSSESHQTLFSFVPFRFLPCA